MDSTPTPAFNGSQLGPTLYVLSRPEIRQCEELASQQRFHTKDGIVFGRQGDFAITAYGGERYPIKRDIFLGTYEILGQVGSDFVARRLIHVRRAWEVLDDGASFDYGTGRGTVAVERGSWLYQSDDNDYGTVHADVRNKGHLEAGPEEGMEEINWCERRDRWITLLGWLPPVLSLLAVSSFIASLTPALPCWTVTALIGSEIALLIGGIVIVAVMKRQRWLLRASVQTALELGQEFQAAARLLGQPESKHFPGMTLWRAAQSPQPVALDDEHQLLETLKTGLAQRLRSLKEGIHRIHAREIRAKWLTVASVTIILFSNLTILMGWHSMFAEFAVIWLPSLVAAVHGFDLRKRIAERLSGMQAFAEELHFVQTRLFATESSDVNERNAAINVLCRTAARYSQKELQLALAAEAPLPV